MNIKVFPLLLLGIPAHAAMIRPLDDMKVIEVSISQQDLTRIAVAEDRIFNVFGIAGEYVLEADEEQGQIFIRPTDSGFSAFDGTSFKPLNLTLTTEKGHTQDLRLIPKDQAPEALILKVDAMNEETRVKEKLVQSPISRDEVEALLQACQDNRIPLTYKAMPLSLTTLKAANSETPLLIRELKGEKLRGLTYEVKNTSSLPLILSESAFAESFMQKKVLIIAISMPTKTLNPGERTFVHVVEKL
jgi:type-F conjugative transfer system secretin TraK